MTKTQKWIIEHFKELVDRYGRKYIAVVNEEIVAVGDSPKEVDNEARKQFPGIVPSVILIPKREDLTCIL